MEKIRTFELDRWSEPDEQHRVRYIGMADAKETFEKLETHLKEKGMLPDEYFLYDVDMRTKARELPDFNFALCVPNFGGSEGIYLDIDLIYCDEDGKQKSLRFATGKTLQEGADAFFWMSRIAAECSLSQILQTQQEYGNWHIAIKNISNEEATMEVIKEECRKVEELILDRIRNKLCVSVHPLLTRIGRLHYRKPLLKRCGVNNNLFACAPDGAIYPCDMLMWEDYKLGDIAKGIDSARHKQIINKMVNDKCEDCWARLVCGGMCFADTTQYSEEIQNCLILLRLMQSLQVLI